MSSKTKRELYLETALWMILAMIAAGAAGFVLLKYAMPGYYCPWYPAIPACFIVLCVILLIVMKHYYLRMPGKILNAFLIIKGIKISLTVTGILLYFLLVGEDKMAFGITVLVFYNTHLILETIMFNNFEKKTKSVSA